MENLKPKRILICQNPRCGIKFELQPGERARQCHDAACGNRYSVWKFEQKHQTQTSSRKCDGCGVEFVPAHGNQKFHNEVCKNKNPSPDVVATRECTACGVEFQPAHGNQQLHEACNGRRQATERSQASARECEGCGIEYVPEHGNQTYHSKQCRNKYHSREWKAANREHVRKEALKYAHSELGQETRAAWTEKALGNIEGRLRQLATGAINRVKRGIKGDIPYDKDLVEWIVVQSPKKCWCCAVLFDVSTGKGDGVRARSPSLDRFIPSEGYTKNNVKIICFGCNEMKGRALLDRVRLIAAFIRSGGTHVTTRGGVDQYLAAEMADAELAGSEQDDKLDEGENQLEASEDSNQLEEDADETQAGDTDQLTEVEKAKKKAKAEYLAAWQQRKYGHLAGRLGLLGDAAIRRAKKKNVPYESDIIEWLVTQEPKTCACCNTEFDITIGKGRNNRNKSLSLDRFVPEIGYVRSNLRFLCFRCNEVKGRVTLERIEFVLAYMERGGTPLPGSLV